MNGRKGLPTMWSSFDLRAVKSWAANRRLTTFARKVLRKIFCKSASPNTCENTLCHPSIQSPPNKIWEQSLSFLPLMDCENIHRSLPGSAAAEGQGRSGSGRRWWVDAAAPSCRRRIRRAALQWLGWDDAASGDFGDDFLVLPRGYD